MSSFILRLTVVLALFTFVPLIGCGSGDGSAEPEGPQLGELEQFLLDHPEIAAEPEDMGPEDEPG